MRKRPPQEGRTGVRRAMRVAGRRLRTPPSNAGAAGFALRASVSDTDTRYQCARRPDREVTPPCLRRLDTVDSLDTAVRLTPQRRAVLEVLASRPPTIPRPRTSSRAFGSTPPASARRRSTARWPCWSPTALLSSFLSARARPPVTTATSAATIIWSASPAAPPSDIMPALSRRGCSSRLTETHRLRDHPL